MSQGREKLSCEFCQTDGGGCIVCTPAEDAVAVRTWDRDGSTNVMPLTIAVDNIARNLGRANKPPDPDRVAEIRRQLLAGKIVETELASFRVPGLNGG